jgi:hypothetical protein
MKTTKPIISILFILLTAQAALAWYDPSTQRWLSRDPIGEPGFETLRAATSMPRVGIPISQPSGRWITRDSVGKLGGVNLYEFVQNQPITLHDSNGLIATPTACEAAKAALAAAGAAWAADPDNQAAVDAYWEAYAAMQQACNPPPPSPPASPNCPIKPPVLPPNPNQNNLGSFCASHPAICGLGLGTGIAITVCILQPELCLPAIIIAK